MRATGLQGDSSPEIIEILDDDNGAFSNRASALTSHDTGGPRWIGPVAGAALILLIGYGVASSSSTTGLPKTAAVTSTTRVPTTTVPVTTTTVPPQLVPYYAAEPPREFKVGYVDIQPQAASFFSPGNYALLATQDATAESGRWFSVSTSAGGAQSVYATDAYRVVTDQQSIAISHAPSGQSIVQYAPDGGTTAVTLTAFGWTDDDLIRLAGSIELNGGNIQFSDQSLIADHQLLSAVQPWLAIQNNPVEQVYYLADNNPNGGFGITVAPRLPSNQGGGTFDRDIALRFFLDHNTPFAVDGHSAVAGSVVGQPDYAMATWIARDHIVTVSGLMPVQQLIAIAQTVHQVAPDEWEGMKFQATRNSGSGRSDQYHETQPAPVSFGTDAEGRTWTINVVLATFSNQQQINWQWDNNGFGSSADGTAKINTVADSHRTYVLADLPRSIAPTAQLVVTRAGLDPVAVDFNDIDPNLDRTFAAYAFSEPGLYSAQIVAADGTVLASWPSP